MKQALFIAFILYINTVFSYINIVKHASKFSSLYDSRLSPMVENMAISKTIEIHSLTKQMERNGQTVFSLCVGEPDYQPPSEVIHATGVAALKGKTKYTSVNGEASLRLAIAKDLKRRKNVDYSEDQIVVANGAKQAIIQALLAVSGPGDEVIVPVPYWPSYPDMIKMCGAKPVLLETKAEENYLLNPVELEKCLQSHPKAKAIILCDPSNPTGSVSPRSLLEKIAKVLEKYPKVIVFADEIYEQLTYDTEHVSFASLPGMFDRTITVNGFSKSHSMTGYRIGYSASPTDIAKACSKIQSQLTSCASSIGQEAANIALVAVPDAWIAERVKELKAKRDLSYKLIMDIPNVSCPRPDGAFYLLPNVKHYYGKKTPSGNPVDNPDQLCLELLRDEQVALVSGDAFGAPDCIRLSYAASEQLISTSLTKLKKFLLSLR